MLDLICSVTYVQLLPSAGRLNTGVQWVISEWFIDGCLGYWVLLQALWPDLLSWRRSAFCTAAAKVWLLSWTPALEHSRSVTGLELHVLEDVADHLAPVLLHMEEML